MNQRYDFNNELHQTNHMFLPNGETCVECGYVGGTERLFGWNEQTPLDRVILEAIGAASVCWSLSPRGSFLVDRAGVIAAELEEFIIHWHMRRAGGVNDAEPQ